ncbi:serine-type endopeptidase [Aureococcus anophagefferens]|nr:serine-type endopeptidase [Aureococcus anophagefferens]
MLARPGALALVALGVARACDCPWQFDGECDVGNGCDCDPFDCSECGRLVTCEACASRGDCVYCAAESLCAPADDVPTPAFLAGHGKVSTCAADDFVAACGGAREPTYCAAAWYLDLMNVEAAWASGVTGAGVRIRVNDDGVDASHPDLAKVSVADSCEVWAPLEEAGEDHGTACAALAAGSANDHCGVGVAPGASLSACAIYGNHESPEAADGSYLYVGDNDVSSNSYGVDSCVFSGVYYYGYYYYDDWTYDDDWWSGSGGTAAGRKPAARKDKFKSKDKTARRSRRDFDFGFDFDFDFEDAAACPFSSEEVCGARGGDWASGR